MHGTRFYKINILSHSFSLLHQVYKSNYVSIHFGEILGLLSYPLEELELEPEPEPGC